MLCEDDLTSYEKYRAVLNEKTVENYVQILKQEKKEKMISLSEIYDDADGNDDETTEFIDSTSEIKILLIKPLINQKN